MYGVVFYLLMCEGGIVVGLSGILFFVEELKKAKVGFLKFCWVVCFLKSSFCFILVKIGVVGL